jgi:hypothetical protein
MEKTNKQRPELPKTLLDNVQTEAEDFQNRILRPLIKMQSDLLMAHLMSKLTLLKTDLLGLNRDQQIDCLTQLYIKDQSFRREVIGMIIGHLTLEEYDCYIQQSKELNRRITQIVLQRAIDLKVLE